MHCRGPYPFILRRKGYDEHCCQCQPPLAAGSVPHLSSLLPPSLPYAAVTSRCQFGPADAFLRAVKGLGDDPQKAEAAYKRALLLAGVWHFPVELVENLEV